MTWLCPHSVSGVKIDIPAFAVLTKLLMKSHRPGAIPALHDSRDVKHGFVLHSSFLMCKAVLKHKVFLSFENVFDSILSPMLPVC